MTGILHLDLALALVQPFNFGQIEQNIVSNEAIQRLLIACALGGVVGLEREWKGQSAGLRTNLLICLACAFFTLMSPILAGDNGSNKGQVAANIVQGIGFLGAGLILHNRNRVHGLASAASIFAVASIGMACGAGLFFPALIATGIVVLAMLAIGFIEWKVSLKKYVLLYEARGSDETAILMACLTAMDLEHQRLGSVDRDTFGVVHRATFSHAATRRHHERLRMRLIGEDAIEVLNVYPDSEED